MNLFKNLIERFLQTNIGHGVIKLIVRRQKMAYETSWDAQMKQEEFETIFSWLMFFTNEFI